MAKCFVTYTRRVGGTIYETPAWWAVCRWGDTDVAVAGPCSNKTSCEREARKNGYRVTHDWTRATGPK
jgi:hypothetical protein